MGKWRRVGESFIFFKSFTGCFSAVKFTCYLMLPRWHLFMTIDSIRLGPVGTIYGSWVHAYQRFCFSLAICTVYNFAAKSKAIGRNGRVIAWILLANL